MTFTESVNLCHSLGGDLHCKLWEESRIRIMRSFRQSELGPTITMAGQESAECSTKEPQSRHSQPPSFLVLRI